MHLVPRLRSSLAVMKNPTYTGENRCIPCTLLNVVLAAVLSIAVMALVGTIDTSVGAPAGVATFAAAAALIYFRGYLIPGTPTFTKRYLPEGVLAAFDKAPERTDWGEIDPRELLFAFGVVVDDPTMDDLVLDPAFVDAWNRSIEIHRTEESELRRSLARLSGVERSDLEFRDGPHVFAAETSDGHLANWPSRAACVADAAGAVVLPQWDPDWDRRPVAVRADLLAVLRLFLERCPTCDGDVMLSQDVVESCCRRRDVAAATCRDCDARLFEMDIDLAME
ncbi:hypothetical protein [Natrialba swarupiae]|uniref:Uncharacterized protein n=1 Tax=Natrialba swarupiae TaxID=2448032 RepID=A0A5D5APR9_9EURY|nr:hypothetical protein [Natrialba swarupiae]TYT63838.1 hypothetical protein FYC77_01060 [Natrialba swarupiae]